jgi:hypothetical protein
LHIGRFQRLFRNQQNRSLAIEQVIADLVVPVVAALQVQAIQPDLELRRQPVGDRFKVLCVSVRLRAVADEDDRHARPRGNSIDNNL